MVPSGVSATAGFQISPANARPISIAELKAYQVGDRAGGGDPVHNMRLMKFFSDEALAKVAAYYASLDPASPPKAPAPTYRRPGRRRQGGRGALREVPWG